MRNECTPKIVIIGAGIAGLCAGVYARKNDFCTEVVEMNHISGGLAMSWRRQEYTFETCLHWLLGSNPESSFHELWNEVLDMDRVNFIEPEEVAHIETEDGERLVIRRDVAEMEKALLSAAPEDEKQIRRLVRGVRRLHHCDLPIPGQRNLKNLIPMLNMLAHLPEIRHWSTLSIRQLRQEFSSPLVRHFFGGAEVDNMSALALLFSLAWMTSHDAAYAIGGSQALIHLIERKLRELGGRVLYNSKVEQILVEDDRAVGVRLSDGSRIDSDWVISAADGHETIFSLLPEKYRDEKVAEPYHTMPVFPSYLQVSLGISRDLSGEPASLTRVLREPLQVDPRTSLNQLTFRIFHFDPTFAPPGKTAVTCFLPTFNYAYWVDLHRDDLSAYLSQKQQLADNVIGILERRIPGIRNDVEVIDIATPASIIRYTGNWKGSMEGFQITPGRSFRVLPMEIKGLNNFRMIGQWVLPGGGLPAGLMTGRLGIRGICRAEHRPFSP